MSAEGTEVGQIAPDFTLVNQDGEEVSLSDYRGKQNVVLVFYVGAFSGICDGEFRGMAGNAGRYDASDAAVIGVCTDTKWTLKQFKEDNGFPATFLADFWPHERKMERVTLIEPSEDDEVPFRVDANGERHYGALLTSEEELATPVGRSYA